MYWPWVALAVVCQCCGRLGGYRIAPAFQLWRLETLKPPYYRGLFYCLTRVLDFLTRGLQGGALGAFYFVTIPDPIYSMCTPLPLTLIQQNLNLASHV